MYDCSNLVKYLTEFSTALFKRGVLPSDEMSDPLLLGWFFFIKKGLSLRVTWALVSSYELATV